MAKDDPFGGFNANLPEGFDYSTFPPTKLYKQPLLTFTGERLNGYWRISVEQSDEPMWIDGPEAMVKRLVDCWNLVRENYHGDLKQIQDELDTWQNERRFYDPWDSKRKPHP